MKKSGKSILNIQLLLSVGFVVFFNIQVTGQQPFFRKIAGIDDFSSGQIKCVYQDRLGFIWFGTSSGAYRFDGTDFSSLILSDSILNKSVTAIFEDSGGWLWFGFEDGGIIKYDRYRAIKPGYSDSLPSKRITSITEGEKQTLWIGTYGEGIFVFQNDKMIHINSFSGLSDDFIYTLIPEAEGNIWAGSDNGINICSFQEGNVTIKKLSVEDGLPDFIVKSLVRDKEGNIWIGLHNSGVSCYDPESKEFITPKAITAWNSGPVSNVAISNGSLWIAGEGFGLSEYRTKTGELVPVRHDPRINLNRLNSMMVDFEGNIWFISNKEINFSPGNRIGILNSIAGEDINNIHAVFVDQFDILWFANDRGLFSYDIYNSLQGNELKHFPVRVLPAASKIMSLFRDQFGMVWIGTFGQGLIRLDPRTGRQILLSETKGLSNGNVLAIDGSEEAIWFATLGGAFMCKIDHRMSDLDYIPEFRNFGLAEGLSNSFIYHLDIDHTGKVWFASDGSGLFCYHHDGFVQVQGDSSFQNKVIYSVNTDHTGTVWMNVSKDGLYKYQDNKITKVITDSEHKNLSFSGIINNLDNELVIAYKGGIDVLNVLTGVVDHFEGNAGLGDINPDPNTVAMDSRGAVWIGCDKGIIRYQTPETRRWETPQTRITSVQVYLENVDFKSNNRFISNQNHVSFGYSGLWFQYPEKIEYFIKLDGHDMDWIKTKNNNVIYSNLAPGDYTFRVKAALYESFDAGTSDNYSFSIGKPFWLKPWFFALLIILSSAVIYSVIHSRERRLKRRQEALREKILFQFENLKSQINPHFLFNSFSTLIALIDQDREAAIEYVEELSGLFRTVLEYKDQDVITLSEELAIVKNYYSLQKKRYGENLILQTDISDDPDNILIPPLTLQLLIENAIKHNVVSKDLPLIIKIHTDQAIKYLFIENNLNKKTEPTSPMGIGLRNIIDRYHLLTKNKIQINQSETIFKVGVPYILRNHESAHH